MLLTDYMFDRLDTVKLCCLVINMDNKVVRHWKKLYPLEVVTGEEALKGFYLEVCEARYIVWNDCNGVLAVKYEILRDYQDVSDIIILMKGFLEFKGAEGLKRYLVRKEQTGDFINVAEIEAMSRLGEPELAVHYAQYRQAFLERHHTLDKEKSLLEEIEKRKREEEQKKAMEAQIEDAEKCIKKGGMLKNVVLDDGRSMVLILLKRHKISVPLKTQGWINQKLASVRYDQDGEPLVRFYRSKGCKCSESVFKYLKLLKQAIDEAA